jgi:hypothetical protein
MRRTPEDRHVQQRHRMDCDLLQPCDSPFQGIALREEVQSETRVRLPTVGAGCTLLFERTLFEAQCRLCTGSDAAVLGLPYPGSYAPSPIPRVLCPLAKGPRMRLTRDCTSHMCPPTEELLGAVAPARTKDDPRTPDDRFQ